MRTQTKIALLVVVETTPKTRLEGAEPRPIRKCLAAVLTLPALLGGGR